MWNSIIELYHLGKSNSQIASELRITVKQVNSCLQRKGLKCNRYDIVDELALAPIIDALVIGDGCLLKVANGHHQSRLSIAHCIVQREYIKWKHSLLATSNLSGKLCYNKIVSTRYKKGYTEEYRFKTKTHTIFSKMREKWYVEGIKIIPEDLEVSPLLLAVLFMDDGYKSTYGYHLCFHCFKLDDVELFISKLRVRYNVMATIHGGNTIYIPSSYVQVFNDIIQEYILPCMRYKLHIRVLLKSGELMGSPEVGNHELSTDLKVQ